SLISYTHRQQSFPSSQAYTLHLLYHTQTHTHTHPRSSRSLTHITFSLSPSHTHTHTHTHTTGDPEREEGFRAILTPGAPDDRHYSQMDSKTHTHMHTHKHHTY